MANNIDAYDKTSSLEVQRTRQRRNSITQMLSSINANDKTSSLGVQQDKSRRSSVKNIDTKKVSNSI